MEFALEVDNLSYSYGNGTVLDRVSFCVEKGGYLSIVGPNGAGKTTLLKNIVRILRKTQGAIKINGIDSHALVQRELAKMVSYVPQPDGSRYPFSVREFVLMGKYPFLNPFSRITKEDEREVETVLESVHMVQLKDRDMDTLSAGERQKVMICASLIQKADILLLDEPTTFLDPKHQEEVDTILNRLNKERKITVISVTHDINRAVLLGNKILALKDGRIVYFGTASDVMDENILRSIYDKDFKLMPHPHKNIRIIMPEAIL